MDLQLQTFSAINLADSFFDSLKEAYPEFSVWYNKKAAAGEKAYVFHNEADDSIGINVPLVSD